MPRCFWPIAVALLTACSAVPGHQTNAAPGQETGAWRTEAATAAKGMGPSRAGDRVEVPPPPFTEGIFPCSACHAGMPVDRERRDLVEMHGEIVLSHDEEHRWCLDCHDAEDRDVLHLAGGEKVPFEESYLLCGQCHGEKLRDWRAGVHGRRSGEWNGQKTYLLCAHCHNPHQPRFKPIAPERAPRRPFRGAEKESGTDLSRTETVRRDDRR